MFDLHEEAEYIPGRVAAEAVETLVLGVNHE
jgi:hypothetical protein